MGERKYAPGPWVIHPRAFSSCVFVFRRGATADEQAIAEVFDRDSARLIAAAPELLAVAKMMLATDDEWKALSMDERARVEAAIQRAEGSDHG